MAAKMRKRRKKGAKKVRAAPACFIPSRIPERKARLFFLAPFAPFRGQFDSRNQPQKTQNNDYRRDLTDRRRVGLTKP
jgi:hypothetical protein